MYVAADPLTGPTNNTNVQQQIENLLNYKQIHFTQFMYKFISRFQFSVDVDLLFGWLGAYRFGLGLGL